jgi:uncharacterized protein
MSFESILDDLVDIYREAFTEEELKQLTAFYSTPVGKKSIEKTPELFQKGGMIGSSRVQHNLIELQRMIEAESERLERLQSPTD